MKRIKIGLITIVALLMCSWSFAQNRNDEKLDTAVVVIDEMTFEEESNFENPRTSLEAHISSSEVLKNSNETLKEKDDINKLINITATILIAIGAVVTAIIAIGTFRVSRNSINLAKLTFEMQERHNLNSVKPIGSIEAGNYKDDIYVRIVNNGIGPLIMKKFEMQRYNNDLKEWEYYLGDLFYLIPEETRKKINWRDYISKTVDRAILPGDKLYLLRLTESENSEEDINELREFLKSVLVGGIYEDIYGRKQKQMGPKILDFLGEGSMKKMDWTTLK